MVTRYNYWFSNRIEVYLGTRVYVEKYANGRCCLELAPTTSFRDCAEITKKFWDSILEDPNNMPKEFRGASVSNLHIDKITKKMLRNSHLFLLNTIPCVQEDKLPVDIGCLLCGHGKVRQTDASIDERTLLEWRMGVTDQERVIIHTEIYEILKENGMTGFKPKSLIKTYYPDNYLLMLWRGASRDYLNNYPKQEVFENFIKEEYGSDRCFVQVPPKLIKSSAFKKLDSYLTELDSEEKIRYKLIPPGKTIPGLGKSKWIELEITGFAGNETPYNDYIQKAICPMCGKRGFVTENEFNMKKDEWDGSDICLTDKGRICVSSKFVLLSEKNRWFLGFEPVNSLK